MATAGSSNYALDQLNDLLQDEVLNILQTYFELKIVQIEGGTLFFFLRNRLHELFHYLTKQSCCSTTPPCKAVKIKGSLTKDQFFLLFENDPSVQREKILTLHCICPLSPNRYTKILALDFTLLNCLIKTSHQTPPAGNPQWITEIMVIRNLLSHKGDTSTVTDQQIEEWWKRLEDAAINIAGTVGETYQGGVKRRIARMKKRHSELEEMMKALKSRHDDFEQKIIDALKNKGVQVGGVPFQITKTEFLKEDSQIKKDRDKCIVVWTFSSPGDWDVEKMQQKLEQMNRLGDFDIQFVYRGSLILHTQANLDILSTAERFKESIEEFLFLFASLLQLKEPTTNSLAIAVAIWHPKTEADVKEDNSMPLKPVDERYRNIGPGSSESEPADTKGAQVAVIQAQLIKHIDISGDFTDCTAADDTYVMCDFNNSRLVIIDSKSFNVRNIPLSERPYDVTAIDNTTVAVTIGQSDIDIINIYSGKRTGRINVDGHVRGLTYSEPHLYLGVLSKGLQVIDLRGNIITTIPTERNVYCMTINEKIIYYSDVDNVSCLKLSGKKIFTFNHPTIKDIRSITTDDTNIYVTCYFSHTVFVISSDGKKIRKLLCESDGLRYPQGICYNRKSKTLMVCNEYGPAYFFNIVK